MTRREVSAGGVVYRREGGQVCLLLVRDRFDRWSLPKGHLEPGESLEAAALREIVEETGITGRLVAPLPRTCYYFHDGDRVVEKTVYYFLVEAAGGALRAQEEEIHEARWFSPGEVDGLPQYDNNRPILRRARELLEG